MTIGLYTDFCKEVVTQTIAWVYSCWLLLLLLFSNLLALLMEPKIVVVHFNSDTCLGGGGEHIEATLTPVLPPVYMSTLSVSCLEAVSCIDLLMPGANS